jgi:hypothetical protein
MTQVKKPISAVSILAAALAALAFLGACASKPPAPAPVQSAPPAAQSAPAQSAPAQAPAIKQEDLDKLFAQAQDLKKHAFDLKLFEVLPDDYKAADALFASASQSYDAKDLPAAKDGLGKTIAAFQDLIARGVVEIAAAKRKEAEDMRAAASKTGADSSQAERFGAGDEAFKAAVGLVDASKAEDAIPAFERSRLYFELAWKRSVASGLRQTIADKDYAQWDSGNYQLADNKYQAEDGFWASGNEADRASGVEALDETILRFNLVIQKGREMGVSVVKDKTDQAKQRSEDIKADVAVKDLYDAAQQLYDAASGQLAAKDYDGATDSYSKASDAFDAAYQAAAVKRANAEEAMKAADEATAESQRKAEEADPLLQSTSP